MELFPDDDRGLGGLLGPMAPRRRTKVRSWNARKKKYRDVQLGVEAAEMSGKNEEHSDGENTLEPDS
jgi:hypothetical protein